MCNTVIDPSPLTALFGVVWQKTPLTAHQAEAVALSTLLARHLTLLGGKKAMQPSYKRWVEEVMSQLKLFMDNLTFSPN